MSSVVFELGGRRASETGGRVADLVEILGAALTAVDPRAAARSALAFDGTGVVIGGRRYGLDGGRVLLAGAGKAAAEMALGVIDVLGDRVAAGAIVVKDGHRGALDDPRIHVTEAAHPWPDARGAAGTAAVLALLDGAGERDLAIVLVSGGASALLEALPDDVPLEDLRHLTDALLRAGATVEEMNVVRKHVSTVKGGRLALRGLPARVVALVLSDVVGAPIDVIASGPTAADPSTFADALAIVDRRGIEAPRSIRRHLERGAAGAIAETPKPGDPRLVAHNVLVADIARACDAATERARALGYDARLLTTFLEGEAREVAKVVASIVREVHARGARPAAVLFGGETTVTLRGPGKGGRNQELALAAALALEGIDDVLVGSLATDGTDGPTDAAGAVVTGATVALGASRGLDARASLASNDAYTFLAGAGALLVTGPTGTNVCDLVVALIG